MSPRPLALLRFATRPPNLLFPLKALARQLESDNARLAAKTAALEKSGNGDGASAVDAEQEWEVVGRGEQERVRLEEVLLQYGSARGREVGGERNML